MNKDIIHLMTPSAEERVRDITFPYNHVEALQKAFSDGVSVGYTQLIRMLRKPNLSWRSGKSCADFLENS